MAPPLSVVMPVPCVTFWAGANLGGVERACLQSVMRHGHPLALYCYREPGGVPSGVILRDAGTIVPESSLVRHRNGSVAIFADRFRYELQRRGCGTWVDTDIYLLSPLPAEPAHLFGDEGACINQAVLRLPPDCPVIDEAIALFEEKIVPPWLRFPNRLAAHWRLLTSGRSGIARMPWGTTGPHALTALLTRHGLEGHALARDAFYPVDWRRADWIRDPSIGLEDMITPATIAVHLWNERIKGFKDEPAPPGSFLAFLQQEGRRG